MRWILAVSAVLALGTTPAMAQSFRAENRVTVTPAPGGFDVANGGGFGARGMWCAAADYARSILGADGFDRIYIAQGRTPPGLGQRAPVRFTMDRTGLVPASVIITGASLQIAGSNLSVDHAYSFCADAKVINR